MEVRSLYLLSYFFAIAFVMAWLARSGLDFYHWSRKAGIYRLLAEQRISLKPFRDKLPWNNLLLTVSGLLFGWGFISWIEARFVREWLLLMLPALAIFCNEFRLTKKDFALLAVFALIAGLHDRREAGPDFYGRLVKVVDRLPPGEIQAACRESIQRRRSGITVDRSCQALSGLHPILDELVFTLRLTGWQASPAFDLALERLAQRAGRQWDRLSRWMVFREQIQPLLQFSQMAFLAVLLYLVVDGIPVLTVAWPSYEVIAWIGLGCVFASGVFYAAHKRVWLRRVVVSALLIASFVSLWQYASLPRLFELRHDTITHPTQAAASRPWTNPPAAVDRLPETSPESQVNNTLPDVQPGAIPPPPEKITNPPRPAVTQDKETRKVWINPCCQPR